MFTLKDCFKAYTTDQDKAAPPAETVARVKAVLEQKCPGVLEETRRVDTGRLGIPVYLSLCGPAARAVMPTRKQMGKGASPDQAEASALMELGSGGCTWSEAAGAGCSVVPSPWATLGFEAQAKRLRARSPTATRLNRAVVFFMATPSHSTAGAPAGETALTTRGEWC